MHHSVQVVLIDANSFARVAEMVTLLTMFKREMIMPKDKEREPQEPGIWHFREVPRGAIVKAKIGAALDGLSVKAYIIKLVEAHWVEMEKKGLLPRGK